MTARGMNFIRNSNFQLASRSDQGWYTNLTTAWKPDGSGLQDAIAVSGFTPSSNTPTIYTNDTKQIQNGSLIFFADGLAGLSSSAHRVYDLVPNVSFALQLPFDLVTPAASTALTALISGVSWSGAKLWGPDGGWRKTASIGCWADDFIINRCPGSKRVLGLRKAVGATEYVTWTAETDALTALRGRPVTFGVMVRQKVGSAGVCLMIDDGVTQSFSAPAIGSSFVDADNNHYEFLSVDHVIDPNAPKAVAALKFAGSAGDICYLGGPPTLKYGTGITQDDLEQPQREVIDAYTHHNPLRLTPFQMSMPGAQCVPGSGLFAYCNLDFEALGHGHVHHSVSKVNTKIEFFSAQVNLALFAAALDPTGETALVFGPHQFTNVPNIFNVGSMWIPLRPSNGYKGHRLGVPGCFSVFSNYGNTPIVATFDMDDVMA